MDIKSPIAEARNEYLYSATGVKLRVTQKWNPNFDPDAETAGPIDESKLSEEKVTDYIGNKIYENGELKRILLPGGYYDAAEEKYNFYLSDHLGNNRVVVNEEGEVIQETHYYPFGGTFAESTGEEAQPYKYNGKELDSKHGLNLYDYSARYYEPAIGRFTTMDPLAEKYYSISPYAYVGNNPISRIDPFGLYYWSTSDPEEIARFLEMLKAQLKKQDVLETFNFSSWNQSPDGSSAERLTFDDETGTFYSSFAYFDKGGEINVVGVSVATSYADEENASFSTIPFEQLFEQDYGSLANIYPEYDIFRLGTKTGWEAAKYLWKSLVNPAKVTEVLGARKGGRQGKGERGRTAKSSGTDNPYKHWKLDKNNPNQIVYTDANGKPVYKDITSGYKEFQDAKNAQRIKAKKNKARRRRR